MDEYAAGLGQYSLRGLELLAQDEGLTSQELDAIRQEAQNRLTEAHNAAHED